MKDQEFYKVLHEKKTELIPIITEMWDRWRLHPYEEGSAEYNRLYNDLMAIEEYDDALSTIIRFHTKRAPVA